MTSKSDEELEELINRQFPEPKKKTHSPPSHPNKYVQDLITFLHVYYSANGDYPTNERLLALRPELKDKDAKQLLKLFREVNSTLKKRDLPEFKKWNIKPDFDPRFVYACSLVTNPSDTRSLTAKCKAAGITNQKWHNWLKNGRYFQYYEGLMNKAFDSEVYELGRQALARNVAEGDLSSFKYFNEMTGKYRPVDNQLDGRIVAVLMQTILSIIADNVDGGTARRIADEIDQAAMKVIEIQ